MVHGGQDTNVPTIDAEVSGRCAADVANPHAQRHRLTRLHLAGRHEQWAFHVFLRHVDRELNLQQAIDAPEFDTDHLISSFYPRGFERRSLALEGRFAEESVDGLRRRGHDVTMWPDWSLGRVTAVEQEDGQLRAGANPRGMQGYAVGR